jgi:uncharacterized repeat protein (TIGR01451 family)
MKTRQKGSTLGFLALTAASFLLVSCASNSSYRMGAVDSDAAIPRVIVGQMGQGATEQIARPAATGHATCGQPTSGLVQLSMHMPPEVTLGQEFMYELNATATACVGNVVVSDVIPAGASYVRSEPAAEVQGQNLIWRFPEMQPGDSQNIKVWLRADQEGQLTSCAMVDALPRVCATTTVGKPALAITKSGPETAQIGSDVTYTIVVSNTGTAVANAVTVTDTIPDGLSHSSGQRQLSFEVGDLRPGESKSIPLTLKADQRGRFCNNAVAASSNAGQVNAEACTTVVQPGVKITKTTNDRELLINRTATYSIVVSNTGDVPLTDVVVTDTAAPETAIAAAEGATVSGNTATWNIGQLDAGQQRELAVKIVSQRPGQFCNTATVTTAQGLRESAEACTQWAGVTGVLVEVVDDPDPIQVGENTTFTVRVTNQGATRDIQNIAVISTFQEQLDPVSASGGATVSGKTVTWPVVSTLAPKQSVTFTVVGKGATAGDHRLETRVTTGERPNPIIELESTTVY